MDNATGKSPAENLSWKGQAGFVLTALALQVCYPPLEWTWAAWLVLVPLILGLSRGSVSAKGWLATGWALGAVHYGLQFTWLQHALVLVGGVSWPAYVIFHVIVALTLGLAWGGLLGAARWLWLAHGLWPGYSLPPLAALAEYLLGVLPFNGIVWGSLSGAAGLSEAALGLLPLAGAPGLVFVLCAVNSFWAWGWSWSRARLRSRTQGSRRSGGPAPVAGGPALGALSLLAAISAPLWAGMSGAPAGISAETVRPAGFIALAVPGRISMTEMAAGQGRSQVLRSYLARTLEALSLEPPVDGAPLETPVLAVWPESSANGILDREGVLDELSAAAALTGTGILLGGTTRAAPDGAPGPQPAAGEYNSAFIAGSRPEYLRRYDKKRLVPFGEYVPWGFGWIFGDKLTRGEEDFSPGATAPVLEWEGHRLGIAICFESILPAHYREAVLAGAGAMITIANDAWLDGPAKRQHLLLTATRAQEVGREVLFVANLGPSALLRPGEGIAGNPPGGRQPFFTMIRPDRRLTPYSRWGLWASLLFMAALSVTASALHRLQSRLQSRLLHRLPAHGPLNGQGHDPGS